MPQVTQIEAAKSCVALQLPLQICLAICVSSTWDNNFQQPYPTNSAAKTKLPDPFLHHRSPTQAQLPSRVIRMQPTQTCTHDQESHSVNTHAHTLTERTRGSSNNSTAAAVMFAAPQDRLQHGSCSRKDHSRGYCQPRCQTDRT